MTGLAQGSLSPSSSRPGPGAEVTVSPVPSVPTLCVFQRTLLPCQGGGGAGCLCCLCHVTSHALDIFCSLSVAYTLPHLEPYRPVYLMCLPMVELLS